MQYCCLEQVLQTKDICITYLEGIRPCILLTDDITIVCPQQLERVTYVRGNASFWWNQTKF
jgi:hypothetical protein